MPEQRRPGEASPPRRPALHREFSSRTLWNISWRYLLRHRRQSVLMILGITLGVAVVVAVDLANASALRAFQYSTDAVAGRATHQIVAGPQGLDEAVYVELRRSGAVDTAAPIVTEFVSSPQLGGQPLQLLGVDPFAEAPFRDILWAEGGVSIAELVDFLTQPGAILISSDLAERYALEHGQRISLQTSGYERTAVIVGLLRPADSLSRRALQGLILADVATAQELTGRLGILDRIDLILPAGAVQAQGLLLPSGARVVPAEARTGAIEQMTDAFRLNLMALSLLALVVGMFLIYNTMTFSVVQRRPLFGTLRSLGVTPREIFALVVSEATIIGVTGAVLGLLLGLVMGRGAVRLVSQTITDLYFVLTVRDVQIPVSSLLKGAALGIAATVLTATLPAWEAASVSPRDALSRSGLESKAQRAIRRAALGGLALVSLAVGLLALPTQNLLISFAGTAAAILGFAMLTPLVTTLLMRAVAPLSARVCGMLGRMAPRDVISSLSRTAMAIAALMVAVSVTIGVSLMVGSFRHTVSVWMEQALQGDIYVQTPSFTASQAPTIPLHPRVLETVRGWPGVERVDALRSTSVDSTDGFLSLFAIDNSDFPERPFLYANGSPEEVWQAMLDGAVSVSEPLARRVGLPRRGGAVTLYTDEGPHSFPVAGIYYDYVSSAGTVAMALTTYRQHWQDNALTSLALHLSPAADADQMARELQETLAPTQQLLIRPNRALRDDVLVIFDRTFAITGALQLLATTVAFIGVLSAILSVQLEKGRERGLARAVGLSAHQLWGLIMLGSGLMGSVAGLLAMPTGFVLSLILIYVINRRAFGWTLLLRLEPAPFALAMIVAVTAALLAGVYPARKISGMIIADVLRFE